MRFLEYYKFSLNYFNAHKKIFITFLFVIIPFLILSLSLFLFRSSRVLEKTSSYSFFLEDDTRDKFSLNSDEGYLYKTKNSGLEGVKEFLSGSSKYKKSLLPNNFINNSELERTEKDINDPYLKKNKIASTKEHYFFTQKISGIPVYGSSLIVHLKNGNEIYSISGNLLKKGIEDKQKISNEDAEKTALEIAKKQSKTMSFNILSSEKVVFNKKLVGLSEDPKNYLTLAVTINSDPIFFSKIYYIDLKTGSLLHVEDRIFTALDRRVCAGGTSCSNVIRTEGSPPSGNAEGDAAYDLFGDIYDFYKNNYGRDGINDAGMTMKIIVQYASGCPNAFWSGSDMRFCAGLVTPDVTWHEMTHGVTQYTARLNYSLEQSGGLNESVSDIFGSDADNNWTIGEGSVLGVIRNMSNPPLKGHPDTIYSSNYCRTKDPHNISGVMNKAFYLMTEGGDFNGCSVSGLGREKSSAIIYYALSRYLSSSSNFKDMYVAVAQACSDVDPTTCTDAKKALQAVQMDQIAPGSQTSPACSGQPKVPATCSDATIPTETPFPTGQPTPTKIPTPTPTPVSTGGSDWNLIVQGKCEPGNVASIKYDYQITGDKVNIQTLGPGVEDKSNGLEGTGSYIAKGNQLTPPNSGLKTNFTYTFEVHDEISGNTLGSKTIKTPICASSPTSTPAPTPVPTSSVPTAVPTATPTPQQTYTCGPCSGATNASGTIQIGQLCCTPN